MGWKTWDVKATRVDKSPRVRITCEIEVQTSDAEDFVSRAIDSDESMKKEIIEQATSMYLGEQDFLIRNVSMAVKNRLPKIGPSH